MTNKPPKNTASGPYSVGYCKPPAAHRFKPGQSGNPKGRPKGQLTPAQVLVEEAARLVKIKMGEETIQLPKLRVVMRKLLDQSMQGNVAATRLLLGQYGLLEGSEESIPPETPLTEEELAILGLFAGTKKGVS